MNIRVAVLIVSIFNMVILVYLAFTHNSWQSDLLKDKYYYYNHSKDINLLFLQIKEGKIPRDARGFVPDIHDVFETRLHKPSIRISRGYLILSYSYGGISTALTVYVKQIDGELNVLEFLKSEFRLTTDFSWLGDGWYCAAVSS